MCKDNDPAFREKHPADDKRGFGEFCNEINDMLRDVDLSLRRNLEQNSSERYWLTLVSVYINVILGVTKHPFHSSGGMKQERGLNGADGIQCMLRWDGTDGVIDQYGQWRRQPRSGKERDRSYSPRN